MFQALIIYFEVPKTINPIFIRQESNDLSNETIKPPTTKNNSQNPKLGYFNIPKLRVKSEESCLKTIAKTYTSNKIKILFRI